MRPQPTTPILAPASTSDSLALHSPSCAAAGVVATIKLLVSVVDGHACRSTAAQFAVSPQTDPRCKVDPRPFRRLLGRVGLMEMDGGRAFPCFPLP